MTAIQRCILAVAAAVMLVIAFSRAQIDRITGQVRQAHA